MTESSKARLAWKAIHLAKDTLDAFYADEECNFEDKKIFMWSTQMSEMILFFMSMDNEMQKMKKGESNEADDE